MIKVNRYSLNSSIPSGYEWTIESYIVVVIVVEVVVVIVVVVNNIMLCIVVGVVGQRSPTNTVLGLLCSVYQVVAEGRQLAHNIDE